MVNLRRKIGTAGDLHSVVRTMKALAASSIEQYEKSVSALGDYYRTVELGLGVCLRGSTPAAPPVARRSTPAATSIGAVVFGSDQGLVGQFNDVVADYAIATLGALPGKARIWAVGERVQARLADSGLETAGFFAVPSSVQAITPLVGQIQIESEAHRAEGKYTEFYVFHNRKQSGAPYKPVSQRLLPLDARWQEGLAEVPWPTALPPEIIGGNLSTLRALIREYLFISLFRACAESLASENASRLAAMERADKNITDLLEKLHGTFLALDDRPSMAHQLYRTCRAVLNKTHLVYPRSHPGYVSRDDNPFARLEMELPKALLIVWPREAIHAMIEIADELGRPSLGDAILLMSWLGARRQDWLAWPANIFDSPYLAWTTEKTGVSVTIPWAQVPELRERIEAAKVRHKSAAVQSTLFFVDDRSRRLWTPGSIHKAFDELRTKLAKNHESFKTTYAVHHYPGDPMRIPTTKLTMRVLRHTCITSLHDAGCVREQIRAITGHSMSSIDEILKRYTALTIDQAGAALAKLVDHQERQAGIQPGPDVRLFGR